MVKVTDENGRKGFYDESTGFISLDDMQKVTFEGKKGYYHESTGFVPVDIGEKAKPKTVQERSRAAVIDVTKGIVETPLAIATGAVGGTAGLIGGIATTALKGDEEGRRVREYISDVLSYKPTSESGKGAMGLLSTVATPLTWPRKIATEIGGEQWGNVADVAMMGLLPKVPGAIRAVREAPYKAGKILYRKTLQPAGTAAETEALTETGFKGGYYSTKGGRAKFYEDLGQVKRQADQIIAKHKGKTIYYKNILEPLDDLINNYAKNTELPENHVRSLERVRTQRTRQWLKDYPDGNIPIAEVQKFKTTLYKRAENAYGEMQVSMTSEARKALARGAREELETVMPEIGVVNRNMKPLLEFEEALDKSIVRVKNEKFSITNTIFNNDVLLGLLARVFKAVSSKHVLADPKAIKAYLFAKQNVDFDEAFNRQVNPKQIEYKPQINLGMEDVSGTFPYKGGGGIEGRAEGGVVEKDTPYIVGEKGAEVFVPKTKGTVIPIPKSEVGGSVLGSINDATRDLLNFVTKPSGGKVLGIDPTVMQTAMQLGFNNPAVANATMEYLKKMAVENPETLKYFKLLETPMDRLKALMNIVKERGLVPVNK